MIAIPRAAFMRSVAVIVRQTPPVRCNDREHGPPSIAIRDADDCEPVHLPANGNRRLTPNLATVPQRKL